MKNDIFSPYLESGLEDMEQVVQHYLKRAEEQTSQAPHELEEQPSAPSARTLFVLGGAFALGMLLGVMLEARKRTR